MKKMIWLAVILAAVAVYAQQKCTLPSWTCKDADLLRTQLALAETDQEKILMTYMIAFAEQAPANFAAAAAVIDNAISSISPTMPETFRQTMKKQYAFCSHQFSADLLAYCMSNPNSYDIHIAIGENTEWAYQRVSECLLQYQYTPDHVMRAVEYLNRQGIALGKSDAEVLGLLKKLNRVFSALLTKDQTAWEKVVAQVRTLMETYE